ncbi:MAG: undecaprenyl-diphosphate phosphatase [bacterium]
MSIINSIILGIVQGLTEFLPVSSSGHIAIFEYIMKYKLSLPEELVMDIGTLIALIFFTRHEIIKIIKEVLHPELLTAESYFKFGKFTFSKRATLVILGSIPVVIAAVLFKSILEAKSQSIALVSIMMVVVGVYMIIAERVGKKQKTRSKLSIKDIIVIGVSQMFALVRGTSRSGVTISTGIILGYTREEAVNMSFLIGMPALIGSSILGLFEFFKEGVPMSAYFPLFCGFLASFISGTIAIRILINFVKTHSLEVFSLYRIIAGILFFILSITR